MLITALFAIGLAFVSVESTGIAVVFFGLAAAKAHGGNPRLHSHKNALEAVGTEATR